MAFDVLLRPVGRLIRGRLDRLPDSSEAVDVELAGGVRRRCRSADILVALSEVRRLVEEALRGEAVARGRKGGYAKAAVPKTERERRKRSEHARKAVMARWERYRRMKEQGEA